MADGYGQYGFAARLQRKQPKIHRNRHRRCVRRVWCPTTNSRGLAGQFWIGTNTSAVCLTLRMDGPCCVDQGVFVGFLNRLGGARHALFVRIWYLAVHGPIFPFTCHGQDKRWCSTFMLWPGLHVCVELKRVGTPSSDGRSCSSVSPRVTVRAFMTLRRPLRALPLSPFMT